MGLLNEIFVQALDIDGTMIDVQAPFDPNAPKNDEGPPDDDADDDGDDAFDEE